MMYLLCVYNSCDLDPKQGKFMHKSHWCKMIGNLKQFAEVRVGHPFRGAVPEIAGGPVRVIQMRDLSVASGVAWENAVHTRPQGRKEPDWLQAGDILFVAKGARNFAVCLEHVPAPSLCSQYFYLIRVRDAKTLLPEFLAWQINQAPAQRYLSKNAEGTDQLSIRRGVLEELPIALPLVSQQNSVIDLDKTIRQERALLKQLIRNRERQIEVMALELLTPE
jgi:hypothetical protein